VRITIDATDEDPDEVERIRLLLSEILGPRHHVRVARAYRLDFDVVDSVSTPLHIDPDVIRRLRERKGPIDEC
jgi:hypothetical protein